MTFWWKLSIFFLVLISYTAGVWKVHDWYDGNKVTNVAIAGEQKAQEGQNNQVQYQQKVRTVYVKVKDPCINTPMPDDVRSLLTHPTKLP